MRKRSTDKRHNPATVPAPQRRHHRAQRGASPHGMSPPALAETVPTTVPWPRPGEAPVVREKTHAAPRVVSTSSPIRAGRVSTSSVRRLRHQSDPASSTGGGWLATTGDDLCRARLSERAGEPVAHRVAGLRNSPESSPTRPRSPPRTSARPRRNLIYPPSGMKSWPGGQPVKATG